MKDLMKASGSMTNHMALVSTLFPTGKSIQVILKMVNLLVKVKWTYADGRVYNGTWIKGSFVNNEDKIATQEYRLVTFFINIIVIGGMLSFVIYWVLSFLKII